MLALLEDKYVTLDNRVNLEDGKWMVNGRTVYDSEKHKENDVTVKQAFEESSNVGMAKRARSYYAKNPLQFVEHLRKLHFHENCGIDLKGQGFPVVKTPKSKTWSAASYPG
jgi:cell division protein FtsI (penicillin-binding protein 3)